MRDAVTTLFFLLCPYRHVYFFLSPELGAAFCVCCHGLVLRGSLLFLFFFQRVPFKGFRPIFWEEALVQEHGRLGCVDGRQTWAFCFALCLRTLHSFTRTDFVPGRIGFSDVLLLLYILSYSPFLLYHF